jgi:hypothetical protein
MGDMSKAELVRTNMRQARTIAQQDRRIRELEAKTNSRCGMKYFSLQTFARVIVVSILCALGVALYAQVQENRRMIQQNTKWDSISRMRQAEHMAKMFDELRSDMSPADLGEDFVILGEQQ